MLEFRHKVKLLKPLSIRDFALLWTGMSVSMLGDGIIFVALAWQVHVVFVLIGGVESNRSERRVVMLPGSARPNRFWIERVECIR